MIVYNVGRKFFEKKLEADARRKELNLPSIDSVNKIVITDRTELSSFLNYLCSEEEIIQPEVIKQHYNVEPVFISDEHLDGIPKFMQEDWKKRGYKI